MVNNISSVPCCVSVCVRVCGQVIAAKLSHTASVSSPSLSILFPVDGLREVLIIEALQGFVSSKQSGVVALELDSDVVSGRLLQNFFLFLFAVSCLPTVLA